MKLMRKMVIIFIGCIIVSAAALAFFIATFDLDQYLGPITRQATKAIGRQVKIGHAGLHFDAGQGIDLRLSGLSIAEAPSFGDGAFVTIDEVKSDLDLVALFSKHEIKMTSIVVDGLKIHLVRSQSGELNVGGLGKSVVPKAEDTAKDPQNRTIESTAVENVPAAAIPAVLIKDIRFTNAEVVIDDRDQASPVHVQLSSISLFINDFSMTAPFVVNADAALFAKKQNVRLKVPVRIDLAKSAAAVGPLKLDVDLAGIDSGFLAASLPALTALGPYKDLKGTLTLTTDPLDLTREGIKKLMVNVMLKGAGASIKDVPLSIKTLTIAANIGLDQAKINAGVKMEMEEAALEGLDLTGLVLGRLNGINLITSDNASNTVLINHAELRGNLTDGNFNFSNFTMTSNQVNVDAKGSLNLSSSAIDALMNVGIRANASARLIKKVRHLQGLLNDRNEIYIPGRLAGQLTAPLYHPDLDYVAKHLAREEARQAISKGLDKVLKKNPEVGGLLDAVLGGGNAANDSDTQGSGDHGDKERESSGSGKLIKGLIQNILK